MGQRARDTLVFMVARVYGFAVTDTGVITNWQEVPHLWEHRGAD